MEAFITDEKGNKKKVYDGKNLINSDFYEALSNRILSGAGGGADIALDNLFTTNSAENYHDGIVCLATDGVSVFLGYIAMITTLAEASAIQLQATGTYTNSSGSTVVMTAPQIGKSWVRQAVPSAPDIGAFQDFQLAAGGMTPQTIPDSQSLTIIWTITFTAH